MSSVKKLLAIMLTVGLMAGGISTASADEYEEEPPIDEEFIEGTVEEVPETIYKWVQSTARANYYFNYRRMGYRLDEDGFIDLDVLMVPTLFIYDDVQKEDVIAKRKWRNQSREGYDTLVGRADYLEFRLTDGTVRVTERVDLDEQWGVLDVDRSGEPIDLLSMSTSSVEYKFYRAIIIWAKMHNEELIERSSGKLSPSEMNLEESEMPIMKLELP